MNYNNGSGGDYRLAVSSPYKSAALDGTDPGADIDLVFAVHTEGNHLDQLGGELPELRLRHIGRSSHSGGLRETAGYACLVLP